MQTPAPTGKPGAVTHACNPSSKEALTGGSLGCVSQPGYSALGWGEGPWIEIKVESDHAKHPVLTSDLHMHRVDKCTCLPVYTHEHIQTHAKKAFPFLCFRNSIISSEVQLFYIDLDLNL